MPIPGVPSVPDKDVFSICKIHFSNLLGLVYDLRQFSISIGRQVALHRRAFPSHMGKTFEDAVEELGFPREWVTATAGIPESSKWSTFRSAQAVGRQLNALFDQYLGKTIIGPDEATE